MRSWCRYQPFLRRRRLYGNRRQSRLCIRAKIWIARKREITHQAEIYATKRFLSPEHKHPQTNSFCLCHSRDGVHFTITDLEPIEFALANFAHSLRREKASAQSPCSAPPRVVHPIGRLNRSRLLLECESVADRTRAVMRSCQRVVQSCQTTRKDAWRTFRKLRARNAQGVMRSRIDLASCQITGRRLAHGLAEHGDKGTSVLIAEFDRHGPD